MPDSRNHLIYADDVFDDKVRKLEDFLHDNPYDHWRWMDIYDVLSIGGPYRTAFRRKVLQRWRAGRYPWLEMNTSRGAGGLGGLYLSPYAVDLKTQWEEWWQTVCDLRNRRLPPNTQPLISRLIERGVLDLSKLEDQ